MLKKSPVYDDILLYSQDPYSQLDGSYLYPHILFLQNSFLYHYSVFPAKSGSLKYCLSFTSSQYNFILIFNSPPACFMSHTAPLLWSEQRNNLICNKLWISLCSLIFAVFLLLPLLGKVIPLVLKQTCSLLFPCRKKAMFVTPWKQ